MQGFPKDEFTRYGGLRMHVRNWGGEGRPVVLLHGLASTCRIWDLTAPVLARDFSVIAVDQRGHGDSGKSESGYDFASVGNDVAAMLEGRGIERPVLVGHSWGADVALELAVAHPGLLQGIVFVDGGTIDASARYDTLDDALVQMAPPDFRGVTPAQFLERVRSGGQWGTLIGQHGQPAEEIILANFETLDDGTLRAKLSRDNHLRIIEALWDHHPRDLYQRVACPVLMMPARQRENPDAYERTLARSESIAAAESLLPNSKAVWLEDSIHDVPVQRPELVAETIRQHIQSGFFDQ
ncbi:Soluble epoxide hydrolase [Geodia barretti]|uniref:Soluble epoxide hydrolase n=1 Tax=Geodia barretti TaxID=519541 RepID=A0AA35X044_GEOBA|nr:Soluble epoxide hydrolase [Geodia barretti]